MSKNYEKKKVMLHFKACKREEQLLAKLSILEGQNWSETMCLTLHEAAERRGPFVFKPEKEQEGSNVSQQ